MNKSKRILSAVLASTTALSSMVAYADDVATTAAENSVTGAAAWNSYAGTDVSDADKTTFNTYLGSAPTVTYSDGTVNVKFSKKKSEYLNDGKVNSKDPVYLVLETNIANTVKASGVDSATDTDGFHFTSGYGWDEADHHEFNFANGKIMLWLPATFADNKLTDGNYVINYKVGNGTEQTINIKYEYEPEEEEKTQIKVENLTVSKGIDAPETMSGTELTRYQDNKALYSFGTLGEDADGNSTLHIDAPFGSMKGDGTAATTGKNVLVVLAFDKLANGYKVVRTKDAGTGDTTELDSDGDMGWYTDGAKFVQTADPTKSYFTLWISLTDDRIENGMEFTITPTVNAETEEAVSKKLKIDFTDTTEYTLNAPAAAAEDKYTVTIAAGTTNSEKKVTLTPKEGVEIKSATVKGVAFTKDTGKNSWSGVIDVKDVLTSEQIADGTTTAALVAGDFAVATVEDKIHLVGAGKSTKETDTMTTAENERLTHNNSKITIGNVATDTDGNYTITVDTKFGEMKGDPEDIDSTGKNALIMLEFNATDDITIKKQGGSDLPAVWKEHATKFVTAADGKQYFTLWVSVTDDRIADTNGVKYTIYNTQGGQTQEKTLTVKFTNSTTYTLTSNVTSDDYTVTTGTVDANGEATVTVKAKDTTKTVTAATLKKGDASTITLTPDGNGGYAAKVAVKDLLTNDEIKEGTVAKALAAADFTVTVAAQSDIVPAGMTVGIEAPASMSGAELTRYQNNRKLYSDKLVWDNASRTATLKVPAELMTGDSAATPGTGAANVCLILKLATALTADEGDYGLTATGIENIDVEDGWKFVQGATEADKGKYVVLWINANAAALSSGNKVVIYEDSEDAVIATVNLVKIPGVKPSAAAKPTGTATTDTAIITAAKTLLTGDVSDDNLEFAVGTIPAASGEQDVTVTVTPKGDTVLVNGEGNVVTSLELTVGVTVAASATVNITAPTNGTFTVKAGDTEIADGETAAPGATITLTATPASGYKLGSWTVTDALGNAVEVAADGTFTMPAGGVTIAATFTVNSTTPSGGGSTSGGGSVGGGGSTVTSPTSISVTNKTITSDKNAITDTTRVDAKPGETTTDSKGTTVTVAKSDSAVSYVKVEAPATTSKVATWAEVVLMTVDSAKLPAVKKSVEEAVQSVANGNGFALNVDILNSDRKTVEPGKNVEITVPVPAAFKNKTLYAYRITARGAVQVLATVADGKITLNAGGAGEYIITAEKLTNAVAYKKGNVSGNGTISTTDATLTLKHILDMGTALKDEALFAADKDGNGIVNAKDATDILKEVLGIK